MGKKTEKPALNRDLIATMDAADNYLISALGDKLYALIVVDKEPKGEGAGVINFASNINPDDLAKLIEQLSKRLNDGTAHLQTMPKAGRA